MSRQGREHLVVEVARGRLSAVLADRASGRLRVRRALCTDLPPWLDSSDRQKVGAWVGDSLRQAKLGSGRALFLLGRELVVLKRLSLPTTDPADLPDMTRLAVQRELPFKSDDAVIDFVQCGMDASQIHVLAMASPASAVENARTLADAAGIALGGITLRSMGSAGLISQSERWGAECVLCIDISRGAVDFTVLDAGQIRFSRAAEIAVNGEAGVIGEAVLTETRRTWMSYRIVDENAGVRRTVLMGDEDVVEYVRQPLEDMLHLPVEVLDEHVKVDTSGEDVRRVWPLIGVLLESIAGGGEARRIDFASPRKAPDRNARKRQRAMAAAGIAVVGLIAAWTFGRQSLQTLREDAARLTTELQRVEPRYEALRRDLYQLNHVQQWDSVRAEWLPRMQEIAALSPSPEQLVFSSWSGSLEFPGVAFDDKTGQWHARGEVALAVDGEAASREVADTMRASLVRSEQYRTSTTGAETTAGKRLPAGFAFRLVGDTARPVGAAADRDDESKGATP
jgi:hypothetical protein